MLTRERESSVHGLIRQLKVSDAMHRLLCYDDSDNDKDGAMTTTTWSNTVTKMLMWHCS